MYRISDNQISLLDLKLSKPTARSERAELVGTITDRLNLDRKPPYKQLTYKRVAFILAHIPTKDLYYVRDYKTKNWSKWFWFVLRPPVDK